MRSLFSLIALCATVFLVGDAFAQSESGDWDRLAKTMGIKTIVPAQAPNAVDAPFDAETVVVAGGQWVLSGEKTDFVSQHTAENKIDTVIWVADRIQVNGHVTINGRVYEEPIEGTTTLNPTLIVFVNHLDFEESSSIRFSHLNVIVVAGAVSGSSGASYSDIDFVRYDGTRDRASMQTKLDSREVGSLFGSTLPHEMFVNNIVQEVTVDLFRKMYVDIVNADFNGNRSDVIRLLRQTKILSLSAVSSDLAQEQLKILQMEEKYSDTIIRREINVSHASLIKRVVIYAKSGSLENFVEPDATLLVPERTANNETRFGTLSADPNDHDILRLSTTLKLSSDPWTQSLVEGHLGSLGETVSGVFTGWDLRLSSLPDGFASVDITVDGTRIDLDMKIFRESATLVMSYILSERGLPLSFDWTYPSSPPYTAPTPLVIYLSAAHVAATTIKSVEGKVTNETPFSIAISYYRVGDTFEAIEPTVVLNSGETMVLPTVGEDAWIPPEAVSRQISIGEIGRVFQIANETELVQVVNVTNVIPASQYPDYGLLEKLTVRVSMEITSPLGEKITVPGGTRDLAPGGIQGAAARFSFIRPLAGQIRVIVEGTAYFENAEIEIPRTGFETFSVNISPSFLLH